MQCFVKVIVEVRVRDIKLGNRRLILSEYNTTINVMEAVIIAVGLIRIPAIVIEDVF
jgi:hypothetical protein